MTDSNWISEMADQVERELDTLPEWKKNDMSEQQKPTIVELEAILAGESDKKISILPNGEVIVNDRIAELEQERDTLKRQLALAVEGLERLAMEDQCDECKKHGPSYYGDICDVNIARSCLLQIGKVEGGLKWQTGKIPRDGFYWYWFDDDLACGFFVKDHVGLKKWAGPLEPPKEGE